jgi:NAD(P)-dependent dehydrogenase (short-subunit alcohol dehydrogenase family)
MQSGEITKSIDNVEMVYQVNHLSHFLLVRLLLPSLTHETKAGRIVHVSSSMHYIGTLDHDGYSATSKNLNPLSSKVGIQSYSDSKLMNVVFSNALESRLRLAGGLYSKITSVAIHPGFVVSELDRGLPKVQHFMRKLRDLIARPTVDGAIAQVTAATLPSLISRGGGLYFEDHCIMSECSQCMLCTLNPAGGVMPHSSATNQTDQDWLWNTSSEIVGLRQSDL